MSHGGPESRRGKKARRQKQETGAPLVERRRKGTTSVALFAVGVRRAEHHRSCAESGKEAWYAMRPLRAESPRSLVGQHPFPLRPSSSAADAPATRHAAPAHQLLPSCSPKKTFPSIPEAATLAATAQTVAWSAPARRMAAAPSANPAAFNCAGTRWGETNGGERAPKGDLRTIGRVRRST